MRKLSHIRQDMFSTVWGTMQQFFRYLPVEIMCMLLKINTMNHLSLLLCQQIHQLPDCFLCNHSFKHTLPFICQFAPFFGNTAIRNAIIMFSCFPVSPQTIFAFLYQPYIPRLIIEKFLLNNCYFSFCLIHIISTGK